MMIASPSLMIADEPTSALECHGARPSAGVMDREIRKAAWAAADPPRPRDGGQLLRLACSSCTGAA
jgi:hypothetical protein